MLKVFSRISLVGFILFTGACTSKLSEKSNKGISVLIPAQQGEALAQVGNITLTLEGMSADFLDRQGRLKGAPHLNTKKRRTDYVENQVIQEAMFQEAIAQGYFSDPSVLRNVKKIVVQKLMRDKLESGQKAFVPTKSQMQEHYNKNLNLYKRDEAIKTSYLFVPYGANRKKSLERAGKLKTLAKRTVKRANNKSFGDIVKKNGKFLPGATAEERSSGNTGYLGKDQIAKKFGAEVYPTLKQLKKIGQISPVISGRDGYLVFMKTGFRKALDKSFEQSREAITRRLKQSNRGNVYTNLVEELRKKYNIKVNKEKIASIGKIPKIDGIKNQENVASK